MFFTIGGKKIWYEVYGAEHSDTLLYLHGGPGASCLDFEKQAKALGQKIVTRAVFEDSGHFPRLEETEEYTNTVLRFLNDV